MTVLGVTMTVSCGLLTRAARLRTMVYILRNALVHLVLFR